MLTEYTTPGTSVEVRDDETIYSLLTERIERTGESTIIAERKTGPGKWVEVTTGEFHNDVIAAAKGLIAFGINKGDAVTIFSTTRYEWGVLDFALAAIGAAAMMLDFLGETEAAKDIEKSVEFVTAKKMKSQSAGKMGYSTSEVGDLVVENL